MRLDVHAPPHDYPIYLESGALNRVGELLPLNRRALIVTGSGVPAAYAEAVAAACKAAHTVRIPAGEGSKTLDTFEMLLSEMLNAGLTRSDCVVAVGGGMVGDLSGFAAACYLRGIDFYNVPTTLLSQVDSSIGGKTAVDFGGVKNSVGAFWPPKGVVIDPALLSTLPARQLHAGLAEVIKMALTCDAALFRDILDCENLEAHLPDFIFRSLQIKKRIVEEDPGESGLRRVLNYGHTIGHAVEALSGGMLLHGECVALGMLPFCGENLRPVLRQALEKFGLPMEIPYPTEALLPYIRHDKKMQTETIVTVCCDAPGTFRFQELLPAEIAARMEGYR